MYNIKDIKKYSSEIKDISLKENNLLLSQSKMKKLVKATYMLTELFPEEEPLSTTLRAKSLGILEIISSLSLKKGLNKMSLREVMVSLMSFRDYFDIAFSLNFISPMNYDLLSKEIKKLQNLLHENLLEERITQTLLNDVFINNSKKENLFISEQKEKKILSFVKQDSGDKKGKIKNIAEKKQNKTQKETKEKDIKISKKDKRHADILSILEQKKDASVKDISLLFKDYSDKTIQRDLNLLIKQKKVVKHGDKRWATYRLKK